MITKRLINTLSVVIILFSLVLIGWQPELVTQLPLSQADKKLIAEIEQHWQQLAEITPTLIPSPSQISPTEFVSTTTTSTDVLQPVQIVIRQTQATESAVVKRVIDGDTIELTDGRTVRYIGIDTPETKHPTKGVECYGQAAADFNRQLVEGKTVVLEPDVSSVDRYGRLLRYVWLDAELINWQLVAEGYALASAYPPDVAHQNDFNRAADLARQNGLGLWGVCQ